MKSIREIPGSLTKVDLATGGETHERMAWTVLVPLAGRCQICAAKHKPEEPHNAQSLYYQMTFNGMVGRAPTWADALAHCAAPVREAWTAELKRRDAWSEPPNGEKPIAHHGVSDVPGDVP
jgi:hypothetical protein